MFCWFQPFAECKKIMLHRGKVFLKKLKEARGRVAKLASGFITDGCVSLLLWQYIFNYGRILLLRINKCIYLKIVLVVIKVQSIFPNLCTRRYTYRTTCSLQPSLKWCKYYFKIHSFKSHYGFCFYFNIMYTIHTPTDPADGERLRKIIKGLSWGISGFSYTLVSKLPPP